MNGVGADTAHGRSLPSRWLPVAVVAEAAWLMFLVWMAWLA